MSESIIDFVREELRNWKKSPLQLQLESEGWEWLTNYRIASEDDFNPEGDPTLNELKRIYDHRYPEVRFEQSYDANATPLSKEDTIAIYIRRDKQDYQ